MVFDESQARGERTFFVGKSSEEYLLELVFWAILCICFEPFVAHSCNLFVFCTLLSENGGLFSASQKAVLEVENVFNRLCFVVGGSVFRGVCLEQVFLSVTGFFCIQCKDSFYKIASQDVVWVIFLFDFKEFL